MYVLMGPSAAGKDTIARSLESYGAKRLVSHTTRPMRVGEKEGVEYHFLNDETFLKKKKKGDFLEDREYTTKAGVWRYGSEKKAYQEADFCILTPDGIEAIEEDLVKNGIRPVKILVTAPDETRVERSRRRGDDMGEVIRRLEDDKKRFSGVLADVVVDTSKDFRYDLFAKNLAETLKCG
jgi:guanylate kinase